MSGFSKGIRTSWKKSPEDSHALWFSITLLRSRMSKQGQIDKRVRDPINKNLLQRKFSSFPLDFEFWLRQAEKLKGKEESSFEE